MKQKLLMDSKFIEQGLEPSRYSSHVYFKFLFILKKFCPEANGFFKCFVLYFWLLFCFFQLFPSNNHTKFLPIFFMCSNTYASVSPGYCLILLKPPYILFFSLFLKVYFIYLERRVWERGRDSSGFLLAYCPKGHCD